MKTKKQKPVFDGIKVTTYKPWVSGDSISSSVTNPLHYKSHPSGIECIQVTEHMNFNLGNAVKYIWRHEGKAGVEDLRKAAWYIYREIKRITKETV